MLRHACGYALADAGHDTRRIQDWLGHRSIQHATRYTQLARRRSRISGGRGMAEKLCTARGSDTLRFMLGNFYETIAE